MVCTDRGKRCFPTATDMDARTSCRKVTRQHRAKPAATASDKNPALRDLHVI